MGKLISPASNPGTRLRELISGSEPLLAPGAFDGLSARLIEEAGFECVYMTGFGAAASVLGRPDVGLLTMTEMVEHARQIAQAVTPLPVIADADTGYGNPISVIRTIQQYELAGVAGIHIEDQVAPKKCGHMAGKEVIPRSDMVGKIEAAVAARKSSDFVIIARTDARAVEGLDSAIDRAKAYRDAGADALFIEAPEGVKEIERVAETFPDVPLLYNWAEGGKTPPLEYDQIKSLGFRIVIFPVGALLAATMAIREELKSLREHKTPIKALDRMVPFSEFLNFVGLPDISELEQRFKSR